MRLLILAQNFMWETFVSLGTTDFTVMIIFTVGERIEKGKSR